MTMLKVYKTQQGKASSAQKAASFYVDAISALANVSLNHGVTCAVDVVASFEKHDISDIHAEIMLTDFQAGTSA